MWIETIVMPREEPAPYIPAPQRDRTAAHARACAEGTLFRDTVIDFLDANALMDAVKWVSDAGSVPLVTLHCTSSVLEQLQKEPRFEAGRSLACAVY